MVGEARKAVDPSPPTSWPSPMDPQADLQSEDTTWEPRGEHSPTVGTDDNYRTLSSISLKELYSIISLHKIID